MITIFPTPKAFVGPIGMIQHDAIPSSELLHPDIEIILVGDDAGAAEVSGELGIHHTKTVAKEPIRHKISGQHFRPGAGDRAASGSRSGKLKPRGGTGRTEALGESQIVTLLVCCAG